MKKTIGIIGGMGPMATVDLFKKIVEADCAPSDQESVHVYIDNNTNIPDRTEAILHGGKNPVPEMVKSAVKLEALGADVLVMGCNTAHYFYDDIVDYVRVPILNMLQETAMEAKRRGIKKVGLLATDGTIQSDVYKHEFDKAGIEIIVPSVFGQKMVMDVIYNVIKAGRPAVITDELKKELQVMFAAGAETLILGCTELPLLFAGHEDEYPFIDPTAVLAKAAVSFALEHEQKVS